MNVKNLRNTFLLLDGAMGTMLQRHGLASGEKPEAYNLTHPEILTAIHEAYAAAGSQVLTANTFGANRRKLGGDYTPERVITAGVKLAKQTGLDVALDLGPIGELMEPLGTLTFDDVYELYKEQVTAGAAAGADLVIMETLSDLREAKAAILAVKENSTLPVFCTLTFDASGRSFMGVDPQTCAIALSGLGVDALGINCSLGPKELLPMLQIMAGYSRVPLMVQANAGLPVNEDGKITYPFTPEEFAAVIPEMAALGVTVFGGCCGTTPEHIGAIAHAVRGQSARRLFYADAQAA